MLVNSASFHRHRVPRRRILLTAARSSIVALLALGCSDVLTSARPARSMKANMSVSATIASRNATQVLLFALYSSVPIDTSGLTDNSAFQDAGPLGVPQIVDLTSAASQSVSMSVDLSACLASAKLPRGGTTCPYVYIEAFLLTGQNTINTNDPAGFPVITGNNLLDVDIVGPFSVSLDTPATTPRALLLHEVERIEISPSFASLLLGQSTNLSATVVDLYGNPVTGKTVTWTSANTAVATVSSAGQVTAVAGGSTTITAAAGGRSAQVPITVQLPRLVANTTVAQFIAVRGQAPSLTPTTSAVALTSSAGATSPVALSAPTISYTGTATNWLSASLNTSTTPATLTIVPTNTANLPNGNSFATVTVRPTNTAIASVVISVSINVSTGTSTSFTVRNSGKP